ncbi:MAG: membrane protein insertase YidC [Sulfurospirillum sp.]|nr:MAG: membrane protein insertase YidC [Sulfurospirillum sp.]
MTLLDKMTQQQRMLLAIVLSFLFFVIYDFMLPKPKTLPVDANATAVTQPAAQNSAATNAAPAAAASTAAPQAAAGNAPAQTTPPADANVAQSKNIAEVHTKAYHMYIDELGRVSKFEVLIEKFKTAEGKLPNMVSPDAPVKPLEIRFSDPALNAEAFKTPYSADLDSVTVEKGSKTVTLTQKLSALTVTKKIIVKDDGTYDVEVKLSKPADYYISPGFRPDEKADMYTFKGVLIRKADGTIETIADGKAEGNEVFMKANIAAASDRYFTNAFFDFQNGFDVYVTKDAKNDPLIFVKGKPDMQLHVYSGAKEYDKLASIDPRMTDIIEYGFFTFIAKPMFLLLKSIYNFVGNWGWAIVITTILLRLILFPLTYKGMVSMNRLKELSPKVKEIQKKYKGDPAKMNAKMMELYKKHNANPMGGCLPMLLQIPVFFAIYRVLLNAVELKHAPWIGWIHDLSAMDPYFILPVLMAATMFWQQHITPNNITDPMQAKIMKFLPLIFMFFFVTFPAGLTLYWFVNNLFGVAQQYYVNSLFAKEKAAKAA